jgi:transcriptional regulator with XRE-family HTH domain
MGPRREERPSKRFRKTRRYQLAAREVGARVRRARSAQTLTLERAAELTGLDFRHLQQIETGTINITLATLLRLAAGLGVEPAWFLSTESPGLGPGGGGRDSTVAALAVRDAAAAGARKTNLKGGPFVPALPDSVRRLAGRSIAALRSQQMTQAELARRAGVSL